MTKKGMGGIEPAGSVAPSSLACARWAKANATWARMSASVSNDNGNGGASSRLNVLGQGKVDGGDDLVAVIVVVAGDQVFDADLEVIG